MQSLEIKSHTQDEICSVTEKPNVTVWTSSLLQISSGQNVFSMFLYVFIVILMSLQTSLKHEFYQ